MKGQVILKNLQWLGRHNPGFPPGSFQTAVAELLNPTASILPYRAWLYLEEWAVVCSEIALFNIDAGATKNVNFQVLMPTEEKGYPVYLKIWSGDQLLETYRADEDVVIAVITKKITVALKNPPPKGNYWQLVLFNKVWGDSVRVGMHIPVGQPMTLYPVPADWRAPLYIDIMIYENPVSPYNIVYKAQSAYGSDWPDYKDITIPDYGSYYYNVATGKIEKA